MANLETLLKKREALELEIRQAEDRAKREKLILKKIQAAGLADLPDAEIDKFLAAFSAKRPGGQFAVTQTAEEVMSQ